tara:strand:+ start:132 stop:365 length:234 start_codon:yes stop_codon:yes gene_type:complete
MPNPVATFDTTMGVIKCEIYLDKMPITASNFIDLANTGFYNGLHFHRVIPGERPLCTHESPRPPAASVTRETVQTID